MEAISTDIKVAEERATAAAPVAEKQRTPLIGGDKHIWGIYITLCILSIVELYSASSREVANASAAGVYMPLLRHVGLLGVGFGVLLFFQRIHYSKMVKWIPLFFLLCLGMLVYGMFFGENINGATRSFTFIISIQPAEFIKIACVAGIALVLAITQSGDNRMRRRGLWICLGFIAVIGAMLLRDGMTNTAIVMAICLAMMLIGGIRIKHFIILLVSFALLIAAGVFTIKIMADHGISLGRMETWIARVTDFSEELPVAETPVTADNQQRMYSYMAQANGGALGVFPGNSRETTRLPLAFSDFIYSIIVEDMGMAGGLFVLVLFLWLLARASGVASACQNTFAAVLVLGMAAMIVTQALVHIAINVGLMPVTGQPLPMISKGGSSIIVTSMAFGVMLSVSRYGVVPGKRKRRKGKAADEPEADPDNGLPDMLRTANPSRL